MAQEAGRMHNKELHALYSSPIINRLIQLRRTNCRFESLKGSYHSEDRGVDRKKILK
jgi:hypothetical protein